MSSWEQHYFFFCTRLVQLGPGAVSITKKWLSLISTDRFHSSDNNTVSENAAYQLISGICQRRRHTFCKEFECSTVSLQYMPILNSHCGGLALSCTIHFSLHGYIQLHPDYFSLLILFLLSISLLCCILSECMLVQNNFLLMLCLLVLFYLDMLHTL